MHISKQIVADQLINTNSFLHIIQCIQHKMYMYQYVLLRGMVRVLETADIFIRLSTTCNFNKSQVVLNLLHTL